MAGLSQRQRLKQPADTSSIDSDDNVQDDEHIVEVYQNPV